jgi:hypothetical protein
MPLAFMPVALVAPAFVPPNVALPAFMSIAFTSTLCQSQTSFVAPGLSPA